jgi:cell division septum initiation protein DivIVA
MLVSSMGSAPFPPSTPGFDCEAVQQFLDVQLELARRFPPAALVHLEAAAFPTSDAGYAPEHVSDWLDQQRAWLSTRVSSGSPAERAAAAFDELKSELLTGAAEAVARTVEQRSAAEIGFAKLLDDAESTLQGLVASAESALGRQVDVLLSQAHAQANSVLEQAKACAGELLLEAERERRRAEDLARRVESVQQATLGAIDRAHRALGVDQRPADAAA